MAGEIDLPAHEVDARGRVLSVEVAEAAGAATTADLTTLRMCEVVRLRGESANPNTTRGLLGRLRRCCNLAIRLKALDRDEAPSWAEGRLPGGQLGVLGQLGGVGPVLEVHRAAAGEAAPDSPAKREKHKNAEFPQPEL